MNENEPNRLDMMEKALQEICAALGTLKSWPSNRAETGGSKQHQESFKEFEQHLDNARAALRQ